MTSRVSVAFALVVAIALAVSGCFLVPRTLNVSDFEGTWRYSDDLGNTSTLIVDSTGNFTLDRTPPEVFDLTATPPFDGATADIDWREAVPSIGYISISDDQHRAQFVITAPDELNSAQQVHYWGDGESLRFIVGDVDSPEWLIYERLVAES